MIKLSKKVDYGLMAIRHIAGEGSGRSVNARHIAEEYNIPPEMLAKILQTLSKVGLVMGHNGPKGGYVLAKEPHEMTIGEVIRAIDGPVGIVDCSNGSPCDQMDKCTVKSPIEKIQNSINQLLNSMTVDEITEQPHY